MYVKKYSIKSFILIILITLLVYGEIFGKFSYLDEVLSILAWIYISILVCTNRITKNDAKILLGMIMLISIGIISNVIFKYVNIKKSILIDILTLTKFFIIYIMSKYMIIGKLKEDIISFLLPICKLYSICAFICAILSLFIDLGMTGEIRYGIPSFHFIFPKQHQFTTVTIFVICIFIINMKEKYKKYIFINCFSIFLTTKGPAIIFCVVYIFMLYIFKRHNKIKIWQIITVGIIILIMGNYQIQTYILNENAPRTIFFKHAFEIANNNFPFGSGMASYGSVMAAKDYSQLYYKFGFNTLNGMNKADDSFLYDVGLASIIGQFGWIGFFIYIWMLHKLLISCTNGLSSRKKAFVYAVLIQFLVHSIGAAITSSASAIVAIIGIGIISDPRIINKNAIKIETIKVTNNKYI